MKKEIREKVYNKYKRHCAYCGKEIEYKNMQVDHIIPKWHNWSDEKIERYNNRSSFGMVLTHNNKMIKGTDDFDNLNPSCRRCNHHKATLTIEKFREIISNKPKVLKEESAYRIAIDFGLVTETDIMVEFYFERELK